MKLRTPRETSEVLLRRAPWDAIDSEHEKRIPFDDPSEHADLLRRMVAENRASLHHLEIDGRRLGMLITRVESGAAGRELVVVAASWRGPDLHPLSPAVARAIDTLARVEQCCAIRFHTVRPALARYACQAEGYRVSEIVLRKDVTNGQ